MKSTTDLPGLGRPEVPAPPVRMMHLGLGAFHRSHHAWYTAKAHDASAWGKLIGTDTGKAGGPHRALSLRPAVWHGRSWGFEASTDFEAGPPEGANDSA